MQIAVLGSGDVGKALSRGLARHGHQVTMGTGHPDKVTAWAQEHEVHVAGFADAAAAADLVILCTAWGGVADVMAAVAPHVAGKVLIDVTNPLLPQADGPPGLAVSGDDSAGETVQRLAPEAKVVKCWNIVGNPYMIDPKLDGTPTMFIAGDDADAKKTVGRLLDEVGWQDVIDIGGIEGSRYLEAMTMVWVRTWVATGNLAHAFALVRATPLQVTPSP